MRVASPPFVGQDDVVSTRGLGFGNRLMEMSCRHDDVQRRHDRGGLWKI
jgi:hypothetical protein